MPPACHGGGTGRGHRDDSASLHVDVAALVRPQDRGPRVPVFVDGARRWVTIRVARPDAHRRDAGDEGVRQAKVLADGTVMRDLDEVHAATESGHAIEP